jgi:serine/threonine protein kinase
LQDLLHSAPSREEEEGKRKRDGEGDPMSKGESGMRSVLKFVQDCATGLAEMHKRGVLHCDITPSNIMYNPRLQCWQIWDLDCAHSVTCLSVSFFLSFSLSLALSLLPFTLSLAPCAFYPSLLLWSQWSMGRVVMSFVVPVVDCLCGTSVVGNGAVEYWHSQVFH